MSTFRNILCGLRLPSGAALLVLSALLIGSQVAETAHAETDYEHESCSLCVGSASDNALLGEAALPAALPRKQRLESPSPISIRLACPTRAQLIRGPPTT